MSVIAMCLLMWTDIGIELYYTVYIYIVHVCMYVYIYIYMHTIKLNICRSLSLSLSRSLSLSSLHRTRWQSFRLFDPFPVSIRDVDTDAVGAALPSL